MFGIKREGEQLFVLGIEHRGHARQTELVGRDIHRQLHALPVIPDINQTEAASASEDDDATALAIEREAARKAREQLLEKRSRISRLVRQIEQAVARGGSSGRTEDLLEHLSRLKGRDHPYVAKLRAYWHLKQKQYASAEADLMKVIAANPDDLEAGINLALIEIHKQQYVEALGRLKRLRQVHPEDARVADLIKRLQ